MADNIHPIFDRIVQREERETRSGHRAGVFWLTGLSGSGKSTIAAAVERQLFEAGVAVKLLDGDNVRNGLCKDLGFSLADREENTRRVAELAKLFVESGMIVLASFVSPTKEIRKNVQEIIGADDLRIVFVNTPLEVCESRDVKGLYAKARAGEIKGFTGIDSPYEAPTTPFLDLKTADQTVDESAAQLVQAITKELGS